MSGVWAGFVPQVEVGARYRYELVTASGATVLKSDPLARATEVPPASASVVTSSHFAWGDGDWMAGRGESGRSLRIYEVHLGSWRPGLGYRELAVRLADHVADLGFTHVELLPVSEHPYAPSWGYQVSGYYAPTARFGVPDDFRFLVDHLHRRGIGVIVDWVPAHFPKDDWALARFDGTALYEHADPRQGEHPDWGTLVFNYGRNEVRNFLIANALYWLEEFHVDGLRVDAVASMLYLDYSRPAGAWIPNRYGGRENLEAIDFLRDLNRVVRAEVPGALMIAEESTSWPAVSRPVDHGGLGFTHKWNMGWMHDTLGYFERDPVHRRHHHRDLTFGLLYAYTERFVLPLSHDEVVHGKRSLFGKMPGDEWQRFANLRALYGWMWAYPGAKLLFAGGELAQRGEWDDHRGIDWSALDAAANRGVLELVRTLNRVVGEWPALQRDHDAAGFQWLDADDADHSVYAFLRWSNDGGQAVACVANLTPVPRPGYRLGVPWEGRWTVLVDSDDARFEGSGFATGQTVEAGDWPHQGQACSAVVDLPPLGVLLLGSPA
jgi:1,4-alpha-glucan branching enzyme